MTTTNRNYVASNRFEELGCKMQENSRNWDDAVQKFDKSCTLCTMHDHDGRKDCASCPIRAALLANVQWHGLPLDHPWVEKELALA